MKETEQTGIRCCYQQPAGETGKAYLCAFFSGMSKAEIARIEGVNKCQYPAQLKSIKNIEKFPKISVRCNFDQKSAD